MPAKKTTKPTKAKATRIKLSPKPKGLNWRQERFCELVAAGKSGTDAYLEAGYDVARDAAKSNACKLLTKSNVINRIAELRAPQSEKTIQSKEDNLRFLTEVITTALSGVTADSPLCTEYTEDRVLIGGSKGKLKRGQYDSGNETTTEPGAIIRRKVKKPDPLKAIELLSKLLGHFEPEKKIIDVGENTLAKIQERAKHVSSVLSIAPTSKQASTQ